LGANKITVEIDRQRWFRGPPAAFLGGRKKETKMFDKLKQLKQLRDLQNALGKEKLEFEKNGIRVTINGKMEIEEIKLCTETEISKQEKVLKDCINDAVRKMQFKVAQKMSEMPGMKNFGL